MQHCVLVEEDTTGQCSKEYGVNSRSILLDLKHFNMCSGSLLPDVMHDLIEGPSRPLQAPSPKWYFDLCVLVYIIYYYADSIASMDTQPSPTSIDWL